MRVLIILSSLLFFITTLYSQPTQLWSVRHDENGANESFQQSIVDNSGNTYTIGGTYDSGTSISRMITTKYNSSGVFQWADTLGGGFQSSGYSLVLDGSGNLHVTGHTENGFEMFRTTIKYNPAGARQWVANDTAWNGKSVSFGRTKMAIDGSGNTYIVDTREESGLFFDLIIILKYNSSGVLQWKKSLGGGGTGISARNIVVDASSNVFVFAFEGGNDDVLIKYNSAGTHQWTQTENSSGGGANHGDVITDASGNVYTTSSEWNGVDFDVVTRKYNSAGTKQWERTYNGSANADDFSYDIQLDGSGNVYVGGDAWGPGLILKYNSAGTLQWAREFNGGSGGVFHSLYIDGSGNVFAGGFAGLYNTLLVKYSSTGVLQWSRIENLNGHVADIQAYEKTPLHLQLDASDNIYVVTETSNGSDPDFQMYKYTESFGGFTWTGAVDTDWFTAGNWSGGVVPTSTDDVVIPNTFNQPGIAFLATGQVNDITLGSQAQISVSAGSNLDIYGDIITAGAANIGNFTGGGGAFNLKGGTHSISGTGELVIVYSSLNVTTGNTLVTNGKLVIDGYWGSLMHGTGTFGGGGTVSGSVRVDNGEPFAATNAYHFWSPPVSGANVNVLGGKNLYYYDPNAATGTATVRQLQAGWKGASGTMSPGVGYIAQNGGTYVSFTGTAGNANTGAPINVSVTKNASTGVAYNLVGNPFPSGLDATEFMNVNGPAGNNTVTGSIYLWADDGSGGSGYSQADFAVWSGAGSVSIPNGFGTFDGIVSVAQSFFVEKVATGTSNIEFRNSMRITGQSGFLKQKPIERFWLATESPAGLYNEILLAFMDDATDGYDALYDAKKMRGNEHIALFSQLNGEDYAIQAMGELSTDKIIPVGLQTSVAGTHTLRLDRMENLDETVTIVLEDRQEGTFQSLNVNPEYTFTTQAGDIDGRFFIHVGTALEVSTLATSCDSYKDGAITLTQGGNQTWNYTLTNALGTQIDAQQGFNGVIDLTDLESGLYTLELTDSYGYTVNKTIEVKAMEQVEAVFIADKLAATVAEPIQFSSIITGSGDITWDMGDGTILHNVTIPSHSYAHAGTYTVSLNVENDDCSDLVSEDITVSEKATGIIELEEGNISAYSYGKVIYLNFNQVSYTNVDISIYNAIGQQLFNNNTATDSRLAIALNGQADGFYLVKIETPEGVSSTKVMLVD